MNKKSSKRLTIPAQTDSKLITCALHVSETLTIPIRQEMPAKRPVHFAGSDLAETNENLLELMSASDLLQGKSSRLLFNAPTFAEMMLDMQKLEATLQAIEAGEDMLAPMPAKRMSLEEHAPEQFFFAGVKNK